MRRGHAVSQLLRLVNNYGLDDDPDIAPIAMAADNGRLSEGLAQAYLVQLQERIEELEDFPNFLHRLPEPEQLYEEGHPDIEIGTAVDDSTLRLGLRTDMVQDCLIAGCKGSGKTTTILGIIDGYEQANCRNPNHPISLIVIDRKAGDYAHLPERYGDRWIHLSIHDPRTHIGLNGPPDVPPTVWINQVATIFSARAGLIAAWGCMANMMRWLLPHLNSSDCDPLNMASLPQLLGLARSVPLTVFASKPDYEKSLIQASEAAVQSTHLFDCSRGLDIEREIISPGKSLVLDIANFSPTWVRRFAIDLLMAQCLTSRMHRHVKSDRPEVVFVLDEADADVTPEADHQYPDGMSINSQGLRYGRELGVEFIIGLSRVNRGSDYVQAEPSCQMIFNQSDARSMRDACQTLALPPAAAAMLPALKPGECLFRRSQSCWTHPIKVRIDHHPVRRQPQTRPYDTHDWVETQPLHKVPGLPEAIRKLRDETKTQQIHRSTKPQEHTPSPVSVESIRSVSSMAHRLLSEATSRPWWPAVALWRRIPEAPHFSAQQRVYQELAHAGFAAVADVRIGKTTYALIEATTEGYKHLGIMPPHFRGRGKVVHRTFAYWMAMVGRKRGYRVEIEYLVPGTSHSTDVLWRFQDGRQVAIEAIDSAETNLPSHILACLDQSNAITEVRVIVAQKVIAKRINTELRRIPEVAPFLDRVLIEPIEPYMKEALA